MLLDADVQAGVLTDHHGRVDGLVTVGMVADWFRADAAREPLPDASADTPSAAAAVRA
jgi:hypothetical protein